MRAKAGVLQFHIPWGVMLALAFGVLAATLTVGRGLPTGFDSSLHLYRVVELDHLIKHGLPLSRWNPLLGLGYGFPLFNYYPPLFYYLAELPRLVGVGTLTSLQLILGLAVIGGAVGMYCWAADLLGSGPGVVAATAFAFAPYTMYTLVTRAGYPEVLTLALMPWGLWALHRYADRGKRTYGLVAALVVAAILLTHLFSAWWYTATLLIYAVGLGLVDRRSGQRAAGLMDKLWPIALGMALSAFFWIPAMVEANAVQIERVLHIANPAAGEGLIPASEVLTHPALPWSSEPLRAVPPRLSWLVTGIALFGAVMGLIAVRLPTVRVHAVSGLVVVGVAIFLHTPGSHGLWTNVPMLRLGQFPFRFLGAASIWLALLAGLGVAALLALLQTRSEGWHLRGLLPVAVFSSLCFALVAYTVGWSAVNVYPAGQPTDVQAAVRFERETGFIGFLTAGEYLPRSVKELPDALATPQIPLDRLDRRSLPEGAQVLDTTHSWVKQTLVIQSPEAFEARFNTFEFPGWWARINGQGVPITASDPLGLILVPVPAGTHVIQIGFGLTPTRMLAIGLSLLGCMAFAALVLGMTARPVIAFQSMKTLPRILSQPGSLPKEGEP